MLIERIIELQLRGYGIPGKRVLRQLVIFMTKQKSLRKIFEWIIIYCKNIARDHAPYFPLPGPNHLQLKFNSKLQDVKRVLNLDCQ